MRAGIERTGFTLRVNKVREQGKGKSQCGLGSGSLEETKVITSSKKADKKCEMYLCLSMYIYLETEREED